MSEPRRFGLTERQFVWLLSSVGLAVLVLLASWARGSAGGMMTLYVVVGLLIAGAVLFRIRRGHWWDENPRL